MQLNFDGLFKLSSKQVNSAKLLQRAMIAKLATTTLSHTNIGLTSMVMNCTNQYIVIQ